MNYGLHVYRPKLMVQIVPLTAAELRSIRWYRFKGAVIEVALIAAVILCWSFSMAMMLSTVAG